MLLKLGNRFVFGLDLAKPEQWRDRATPASLRAFEAWDRGWKRRLGPTAGLAFWTRTNTPGCWNLVSRHWPHKLCWDWLVSLSVRQRRNDTPLGLLFSLHRRYRYASLTLLWVNLYLTWQNDDWMVHRAFLGDHGPEIEWDRSRDRWAA